MSSPSVELSVSFIAFRFIHQTPLELELELLVSLDALEAVLSLLLLELLLEEDDW